MSRLAAQVMADRLARDAARARFEGHYQAFKADVAERGIGGRIADEAIEQAKLVFDEAVAVVEEHPGAIGGTLAALVLWLLRNPIIAWVTQTFDPGSN
ncbi:hypothetical protein [Novosphingobium sp. BL-52-GroH]|uniref:hypothetical protein n=1 Tax=Novosphingobium sp. BL-52-GroH TaxID=3349877 RepID=UPI00385062C5